MHYRVAEVSYSYRIAKKRIARHDIFLVLDNLKKLISMNHFDEENYYFLNLKDQSLRTLNSIRSKNKNECFPNDFPYDQSLVFKKMLLSKWHFKMGIAIMGIHYLSLMLSVFGWNKACKK